MNGSKTSGIKTILILLMMLELGKMGIASFGFVAVVAAILMPVAVVQLLALGAVLPSTTIWAFAS